MDLCQYHHILDYLRDVIDGSQWEGHVFAVGGCCRDEILGNEIKDVDLAVDLPGGGIDFAQWLFDKGLSIKAPTTFPSFGTAMLQLAGFPEEDIEIVQTRAEKYTDRTRRDPTVVFGPIEQDCRRRDLTINALYYDISRQKLLDILGYSVDDIHNHIIRTPDNPDSTFDDDPVRILRAVRLAARYGWEIEAATFAGMKNNAARLKIVRPERMQAEIEKMLMGPRPAMAMNMLLQCDALHYIMPEVEELHGMKQGDGNGPDVWDFTMTVLGRVPSDPYLRWAALLHDIAKPICKATRKSGGIYFPGHERRCKPLVNTVMRRLHYDRRIIDKVIFLCTNHLATKGWGNDTSKMTDSALRRLQHKCITPRRFDMLMELIQADNITYTNPLPDQVANVKQHSERLRSEGMALFSFKQQIPLPKLRKMVGVPHDTDMKPYLELLLQLAIENPKMPRTKVLARLKKLKPKSI